MRLLLAKQSVTSSDRSKTPQMDALRSFQLLQDVRLYIDVASEGLMPGPRDKISKDKTEVSRTPVEVRCRGRFRFDMAEPLGIAAKAC